jgi:hypothetical protein
VRWETTSRCQRVLVAPKMRAVWHGFAMRVRFEAHARAQASASATTGMPLPTALESLQRGAAQMVRVTEQAATALEELLAENAAIANAGLTPSAGCNLGMTIDAPHEGDEIISRDETSLLSSTVEWHQPDRHGRTPAPGPCPPEPSAAPPTRGSDPSDPTPASPPASLGQVAVATGRSMRSPLAEASGLRHTRHISQRSHRRFNVCLSTTSSSWPSSCSSNGTARFRRT